MTIDEINHLFYNSAGDTFNKIPFEHLLPSLFIKYGKGVEILEIGSGPGFFAIWLQEKGYRVTCVEPATNFAALALEKGLQVYCSTIQEFSTDQKYDCIVAISSLIHVPRAELPHQIKKISQMMYSQGVLFVSFIEGKEEGMEDPTNIGKMRFFSKWRITELNDLFNPDFEMLEDFSIYNEKMKQTFILRVYLKSENAKTRH